MSMDGYEHGHGSGSKLSCARAGMEMGRADRGMGGERVWTGYWYWILYW